MLCTTRRLKPWAAVTIIGVLIAVDLYTVDKRYLNHDSFCPPELSAADLFPLSSLPTPP